MEIYSEQELDLCHATLIYTVQNKANVYFTRVRNEELIVKKFNVSNAEEINNLFKRTLEIKFIKHESLINIRSAFLGSNFNNFYIVMENYPEGNLEKEIQRRAGSKLFWDEFEILRIFEKLVKGFAVLQEQKISHRNIKPKNILVKSNNYFIADPGLCLKTTKTHKLIEDKSLDYICPKLSLLYLKNNKNQVHVEINPYKSDVFSLGLTFLYMATLTPFEDQWNLNKTYFEIIRDHLIGSCKYSNKIKNIIVKMLEYDDIIRPDFKELEKWFDLTGVNIIIRGDYKEQLKKLKKEKKAEEKRKKRAEEETNNLELQKRDEKEQKLVANTKETTINQNSNKANPYEYMEKKSVDMIQIPKELNFDKLIAYCFECNKKHPNYMFFDLICCEYTKCSICKRYSHKNSCGEFGKEIISKCPNCINTVKFESKDFFECKKDKKVCIVCFKSSSVGNHEVCKFLFNQNKG